MRKSILEKSFKYQKEGTGRKSILEKIFKVSKGGHWEEINPGKNHSRIKGRAPGGNQS